MNPSPLAQEPAADPLPLDLANVPQRFITTKDGVRIAYWAVGRGPKTLLLANGLGGRLYSWEPVLRRFASEYRIITWDYRGLFESGTPQRRRELSIADHARDGLAVLDAEKVQHAVICGWSMGVQVSLELATMAPERVDGLVLLNGTYGHAFSSGFQPWFPFPWVSRWGHRAVEYLVDHPSLMQRLGGVYKAMMTPTLVLFWLVSRVPMERSRPMLEQYRADVFDEKNIGNFLRLFQELDAHSVYHLLRDIDAPALVVSGELNLMTPAYQSKEMVRRMPHAEALHLRRASHFVLVERPEVVLPAIERFLHERARR